MEVAGDLAHVGLLLFLQEVQERRVSTIEFIEGDGGGADAVAESPSNLVLSDPGFGAEFDVVGDVCLAPARLVIGPVIGQVDVGVEQRPEVIRDVRDMHGDDGVVEIPSPPAPLASDADGLVSGPGDAGFIDQQDGLRMGVFPGDDLLGSASESGLVPLDGFEKSLKSSRRPSDFEGMASAFLR